MHKAKGPTAVPNPPVLVGGLARLRAAARAAVLGERLSTLIAALLGVAMALGVIDYVLRLPVWIRTLHWIVGVGALAYLLWRYIRPAWRFAPSLTDLALRLERQRPDLRGLLASAVDFARSGDASRAGGVPALGDALAENVVRRAEHAWTGAPVRGVIRLGPFWAGAAACLAAAGLCLVLRLVWPDLWSIGARRLVVPWTSAAWPKRTGVIDITEGEFHARGAALPLRAAVVRSNRPWDSTYVAVRYRLVHDGKPGETRRELLTWQMRSVEVSAAGEGALFERLIEPAADAFDFRFETEDDATEWRRLTLVPPPAVLAAAARVVPPEYARASPEGREPARAETDIDLGPGTDERAVAPPALAGSRVDLVVTLNKPLPIPESVREIFLDVEADEGAPSASVAARGTQWHISFTLDKSLRLPIRLRDEYGIESREDAVYRFEALADRFASATVTEPPVDRTVLPTALVRAVAEGRDDVGLAWVALRQSVWTSAGPPGATSGPGGALEQRGEAEDVARFEAAGLVLARAEADIDLASLHVKPGDEVRLIALAIDARSLSMEDASPTASTVRTLRVISEAQFVEDLQRVLADVRQAAIRLEQDQQTLRERTEAGRTDQSVRRGQAAVTERLGRQEENVARLVERLRENRFEDRGVEDLLGRARATIIDAGRASSRAAQSLERHSESPKAGAAAGDASREGGERSERAADDGSAPSGARAPASSPESSAPQASRPQAPPSEAAGAPPSPAASDPSFRDAAEAQREVQDHLRTLIELLDRGEDNWIVRNSVERLLREQKELRSRTQQAGQSTAGKSPDQLTPAERTELDRIVEKQSQLSDLAAELAKDMRRREEALRPNDPAAAEGIARAARRAEESQLSQIMRNAASEASQNQTARASRQQQQAQDLLQQMLEDLDRVSRARDEVLRRQLASIIETLRSLVARQERELDLLDEVIRQRRDLAPLDQGLMQLNANTLAAEAQIKAAGAELAPVATLVLRAADAQSAAITEIRRPVLGETMVREHEARSLSYLRQALERAIQIDQAAAERQRRQRLAELRRAYRELLERQVAIRAETGPLAEARELTRRERQISAALADRQDAVAVELQALRAHTAELTEAKVFEYANARIEVQARRAVGALADARPRDAIPPQDALLALMRHVLESLADPKPDESKFAEGAGGGGGGQGGGERPLIPPLKELILLRRLQTDLADRTISLSKLDAPPRADLADLAESQRDLSLVGREFVERMKQQQQRRAQPPAAPPPPPPQQFGGRSAGGTILAADTYAHSPPTSDQAPPPKPPSPPVPDLDELLGLPKHPKPEPAEPILEPVRPAAPELERKLTAQELADQFEEAVARMGECADRIGRLGDVGIPTQRLHEEILRKLDVLIKQSPDSPSSMSSSGRPDQSGEPSASPVSQRASDRQAGAGDNRAERMPPAMVEAQPRARLDTARAAWGNLPERVRQSLLEGSSDYFSALYEAMTEAYYKKLAEESRE